MPITIQTMAGASSLKAQLVFLGLLPGIAVKSDPIADLTEDLAAEQKAWATYEKLIDLCQDNKEVTDVLKYLRQREIVHFQRFGEALNGVEEKLAQKKFYMNSMDKI